MLPKNTHRKPAHAGTTSLFNRVLHLNVYWEIPVNSSYHVVLIRIKTMTSSNNVSRPANDTPGHWLAELSGREKQILGLSAAGLVDKNIAAELNISVNTLRTYWVRIRRKCGDVTRAALVAAFVRTQLERDQVRLDIPLAELSTPESSDSDRLRRTAIYYATALQRIEESIQRMHRSTRVLAAYPRRGLHYNKESELLKMMCKVFVEEGGYKLAWVGLPVNDEEKTVIIAEWFGLMDVDRADFKISWGDNDWGHGPSGTAIRTGKSQFIRDFLVDPSVSPWRKLAIKYGYQSSVALPLITENEVIGVLCAYAPEPDAFDDLEIRLLELVANDFAVSLAEVRRLAQSALPVVERGDK